MDIPGKCPHCGAQIIFSNNNPIAECQYCNSIVILERKKDTNKNVNKREETSVTNKQDVNLFSIDGNDVLGAAEQKMKDITNSFSVREIKTSQKILARYEFGDTHQRGEIWLTDYEVVFKPFKENLGDKSIRYVPYTEISSTSVESSNYFFCKRISLNLHGGKQIHIHIKNLYSSDFTKKIKKRVSYIKKNNLLTEAIAYDSKLHGAIKASEANLYKRPKSKFILKLPSKKVWIAISLIILLAARVFVKSIAARRKLNPGSPAITPEDVINLLVFVCLAVLGYVIWCRIKHWYKSKLL